MGGPGPICGCGTVIDIDGNVYKTIVIGDQCWMMENLKATHYRNGDPIPHITDAGEWAALSDGAYCEYDNDSANVTVYGRLYNWYAIEDNRNIAPSGWHVSTDAEWQQLEIFLGMSGSDANAWGDRGTDEGGKLKEVGITHWNSPNAGATNESGFTALGGGFRDLYGIYHYMGRYARFWSSTEYLGPYAYLRGLSKFNPLIFRAGLEKQYGFSVRCVRD